MLFLSRKSQESVVVGGKDGAHPPFKVTALEIGSGEMNLTDDADADVSVNRLEVVWEKLCEAAGRTC